MAHLNRTCMVEPSGSDQYLRTDSLRALTDDLAMSGDDGLAWVFVYAEVEVDVPLPRRWWQRQRWGTEYQVLRGRAVALEATALRQDGMVTPGMIRQDWDRMAADPGRVLHAAVIETAADETLTALPAMLPAPAGKGRHRAPRE